MAFPDTQLGRILGHPVLSVFVRAVLEDDLEAVRATVRRHLVLDRRLRTLELGCGPGILADLFESQDYVGVDPNRRHVEHARRRRPGFFIVADPRQLDLPNGRFDQVLISGMFHRLPDAGVRAVLGESLRVLGTPGRAVSIQRIRTLSRFNLAGRLLQRPAGGRHVRTADALRALYLERAHILEEQVLRSGIWDCHVASLRS